VSQGLYERRFTEALALIMYDNYVTIENKTTYARMLRV
jgi:hypothetical protein